VKPSSRPEGPPAALPSSQGRAETRPVSPHPGAPDGAAGNPYPSGQGGAITNSTRNESERTMTRNLTAEHAENVLGEDEHPGGDTPTVQYQCSMQELEEAGFHQGFSIRHIDEMPEHESEFIPGPSGQLTGIRDCLAALHRVPPKPLLELVELLDLDWASQPCERYMQLP
jgi:hypothetical protein